MLKQRIRTVKPDLFIHERLFDAEVAEQLPIRLAFVGLFTCCDRDGRFPWQIKRLKAGILPYDEVDMTRVLEALVKYGFIIKYEYENETYGCIPSWLFHQKPNVNEAESTLPPPPDMSQSKKSLVPPEPEKPKDNNEIMVEPPLVIDACLTREARVLHDSKLELQKSTTGREGKGKEGNIRERNNNTMVASGTRPCVESNAIQQIFEHWKTVMGHPSAKLDEKRKGIIGKALSSGYDVQQLCYAITGCSLTPHNMGDNERGQRYDGLQVILRDGDQIDRFMRNYQQPPRVRTEPERRAQTNIHTLQRWLDQKMREEKPHANA